MIPCDLCGRMQSEHTIHGNRNCVLDGIDASASEWEGLMGVVGMGLAFRSTFERSKDKVPENMYALKAAIDSTLASLMKHKNDASMEDGFGQSAMDLLSLAMRVGQRQREAQDEEK